MLVIARMCHDTRPNWIGIAVKHGFKYLIFVFYFRCFRSVVGDFSLSVVPDIVSHAKARVGISHPIAQGFDRGFEAAVDLGDESADFMGVVSHQAEAMDMDAIFEVVGIGVEQGVEIVVFF